MYSVVFVCVPLTSVLPPCIDTLCCAVIWKRLTRKNSEEDACIFENNNFLQTLLATQGDYAFEWVDSIFTMHKLVPRRMSIQKRFLCQHWQCVVTCTSKLKSRVYTVLRLKNTKEMTWQVLENWLCSYMCMLVYVHVYNTFKRLKIWK